MKALILFHSPHKGYTTNTDLTKPILVEYISIGKADIQLTMESAYKVAIYYETHIEAVFLGDEFTIVMEVNND